jgi:hypothetical protein
MATDASRKAVFNTTELLEKIISFLPPFEILTTAQRVSSGWKDTIAASPTVQTLVWQPRVSHVLSPSGYSNEGDSTHHEGEAALYFTSHGFVHRSKDGTVTRNYNALVYNPDAMFPMYSEAVACQELFFTGPEGYDGTHAITIKVTDIGYLHTARIDWAYDIDMDSTSNGTRPAWLDRYITSPPITTAQINVHVRPKDSYPYKWIYATIYDRSGITYGTVAQVLDKMRLWK